MHYFISKKSMSASGSGAVPVNGIFHGFVKGGSSPPLIFTFLLFIFPSPAFLLQINPVIGSFCTFHTKIHSNAPVGGPIDSPWGRCFHVRKRTTVLWPEMKLLPVPTVWNLSFSFPKAFLKTSCRSCTNTFSQETSASQPFPGELSQSERSASLTESDFVDII